MLSHLVHSYSPLHTLAHYYTPFHYLAHCYISCTPLQSHTSSFTLTLLTLHHMLLHSLAHLCTLLHFLAHPCTLLHSLACPCTLILHCTPSHTTLPCLFLHSLHTLTHSYIFSHVLTIPEMTTSSRVTPNLPCTWDLS